MVEDLEEIIGIGCSPMTVGQTCSNSPVCCEENGIVRKCAVDTHLLDLDGFGYRATSSPSTASTSTCEDLAGRQEGPGGRG